MSKIKQVLAQHQLMIEGLLDENKRLKAYFNPKNVPDKYEIDYTNMLATKDRILCANRYKWENLPRNLTSQQLETLFYSFGSLVFFNDSGKLGIATFAKGGKLNSIGQLDKVTPIDFSGKSYNRVLSVYDINDETKNVGVIINDYTPIVQLERIIPRSQINLKTTIHDEVETYKQLLINLKSSIHKVIATCENPDSADILRKEVEEVLSSDTPIAVLSGDKNSLSNLINMFNTNIEFKSQEYCNLIDYYDKIRRSFNGVPTPDTFEKAERLITSETQNASAHTNIVLYDGLINREIGLKYIKKYFSDIEGINEITVSINEEVENIIHPIEYEEEIKSGDKKEEIKEKEETENE